MKEFRDVWPQLDLRVRFFLFWSFVAAGLSVVACIVCLNYGSFFLQMPRLRSEGAMFRDLGHVFIPAFCIGLLAILFHYGARFSVSGFARQKFYFIPIGVLILIPILIYLFGQDFGLVSPSVWRSAYSYSFDDFLFHYGIIAGSVIFLIFIIAVIRKEVVLRPSDSGGLQSLFRSWPFHLLLFAALLLIPKWSDSYWLNLFNGEFFAKLPLFVWIPAIIFLLVTVVRYRRFHHVSVMPLALVNTVLLYLLLVGYWHARLYRFGPLPSAIIPVASASIAWAFFWLFWLNGEVTSGVICWREYVRQKWRIVAGVAGILLIWQFVSYYTYADSRRQQIAIRFVERFSDREGICIDLQTIPAAQREYVVSLLQSYGKKVYTDPKNFPRCEQPAFAKELKYPVLHAGMKPAGLFLSKGNCGYYYASLAALGAETGSVWVLGRWWHIYSYNIWVS